MTDIPTGVVMICTDESGREIASVHDFDRSGYGGFTLQRSQEIRCKDRLARAVIDRYANPIIADAMDAYQQKSLLDSLERNHGHKIHTIYLPQENEDD